MQNDTYNNNYNNNSDDDNDNPLELEPAISRKLVTCRRIT